MKNSVLKWFGAAVLILVAAAVYYPSLSGPFLLDDTAKIVQNPDIRRLGDLPSKLVYPYSRCPFVYRNDPSRPVTYLSFALNYRFGRLDPFGYHLVNVALHCLNVLLLFFLARELLGRLPARRASAGAFIAALLFAVHPVATATVSYVFSRSGELSAFFFFLSFIAFIRAAARGRPALYAAAVLAYCFALFSKADAAVLPAVLLAYDLCFLGGCTAAGMKGRKRYHLAFWLVLAGFLAFRHFYLGGIGDVEGGGLVWKRIPYLLIQPFAVLKYLELLLLPWNASFEHLVAPLRGIADPRLAVPALCLAALAVLLRERVRRKDTGSVFPVLFFCAALAPTATFFPTVSPVVENRLYLPLAALSLLAGNLAARALAAEGKAVARYALFGALGLCVPALCYGTFRKNLSYRDPVLLWQGVLAKYPGHARAHNNLGLLYKERKRYPEAMAEYREAVRLDPRYGEAYSNIGNLYYLTGDGERAVEYFRKATGVAPALCYPYFNLGVVYADRKDYDRALENYDKALKANPRYAAACNNAGVAYYSTGKYAQALEAYRRAAEIDPDYAEAYNNIGVVYAVRKDYRQAAEYFSAALRADPGYEAAGRNLARARELAQ